MRLSDALSSLEAQLLLASMERQHEAPDDVRRLIACDSFTDGPMRNFRRQTLLHFEISLSKRHRTLTPTRTAIVRARARGGTFVLVARQFGLSPAGVFRICKREQISRV